MAACTISISVAVPVVRTALVRGSSCCRQQRVGIASSFHSLSCKSVDYCVKKQCQKQCATKKTSRIKASQEGVPQEILEDTKFVPINDDDPRFGPPAMLLLGFSDEDVRLALEMLQDMGGNFMQVLLCTEEMLNGTLNEALNFTQPDLSQVKTLKGVPRVCFLSGLSGEELIMVVRAFPEAGLTGIAFAAHVPKNSDKSLKELVGEIMGDHERLSKSQQSAES